MNRTIGTASGRNVTVQQIADKAGVSTATVSLVLNRRGDALRINRQTQQRVLDAAKRLNYVPNFLARGLSGASTHSIGMLWPLGGSPDNATIAYQLMQRIAGRGYVTHMTDHLSMASVSYAALRDLSQRRVDGLIFHAGGSILTDPKVTRILDDFPAVVVISPRPADLSCDFIYHDRRRAMRDIADHFVDTGRKNLGIFNIGVANSIKIEALREQLRKRGAPPAEGELIDPTYISDQTYLADARARLESHYPDRFPYDAVVCTNDHMAVALIDFLRSRGLRVPEDVAVTLCELHGGNFGNAFEPGKAKGLHPLILPCRTERNSLGLLL